LDMGDITAAAARAATPGADMWHAQQTLAQVLWEEELVAGENPRQRTPVIPCPPTSSSSSRPHSAVEARHRMFFEHQERMRQNWSQKERAIADANHGKYQILDDVSRGQGIRNLEKRLQGENWKQSEKQRLAQQKREYHENDSTKSRQLAAKCAAEAEAFNNYVAAHGTNVSLGCAQSNRHGLHEQHTDKMCDVVKKSKQCHGEAEDRREHALDVRSLGPKHLHANRQLSHWQGDRVNRIRTHHRKVLHHRLTSAPPHLARTS